MEPARAHTGLQVYATCDVPLSFTTPTVIGASVSWQAPEFVEMQLDMRMQRQGFQMSIAGIPFCELLSVLIKSTALKHVSLPGFDVESWKFDLGAVLYDASDRCVQIGRNGCSFPISRAGNALTLSGPMDLSIGSRRHHRGHDQVEVMVSRGSSVIRIRLLSVGLLTALTQIGSLEFVDQRGNALYVRVPASLGFQPPRRRFVR